MKIPLFSGIFVGEKLNIYLFIDDLSFQFQESSRMNVQLFQIEVLFLLLQYNRIINIAIKAAIKASAITSPIVPF